MLIHQKISMDMGNRIFKIKDDKILSAIECHTTLRANPSKLDMILFIADKIAWDQDGIPPYLEVINRGLEESLEAGVFAFLKYTWENKDKFLIIHPWLEESYKYFSENAIEFVAGNVGPDSGVMGEDGKLNPPKKITHFKFKDNEGRSNINLKLFYDKFLNGKRSLYESKKNAYITGYYVHLITDNMFSKLQSDKRDQNKDYLDKFKKDPNFICEVKKDWYGIDLKYLMVNKKNIFNDVFMKIENIPNYFECFPNGALNDKIMEIKSLYKSDEQKRRSSII